MSEKKSCVVCGHDADYEIDVSVCGERCRNALLPSFFLDNIDELTRRNRDYRRVLFTSQQQQLVLMSIGPQDRGIPEEVHPHTTQFIRVEEGQGVAIINGKERPLKTDDALMVPAGVRHEIRQRGAYVLKLYSIYSPPEHPEDLVQRRRPETLLN
jgi:mannose-6-phosphate isomerase-like protein (cupin superfamily)